LTDVNFQDRIGAMMASRPSHAARADTAIGGVVKNVLIPVDGSGNSLRAVHYVVDQVREHGPCAIHLLNVQPPIASGAILAFFEPDAIEEFYEDEAKAALAESEALLDRSGIIYQKATRVGNIAECIKAHATEQGCDHIVMGSRGLGAAGSLFLGSTTLKVLHTVHIPVVLIT